MEKLTNEKARQYMKGVQEGAKKDGISLSAWERYRGEWYIVANDILCCGPGMPAEAAAYAMHTLWLYMKHERQK